MFIILSSTPLSAYSEKVSPTEAFILFPYPLTNKDIPSIDNTYQNDESIVLFKALLAEQKKPLFFKQQPAINQNSNTLPNQNQPFQWNWGNDIKEAGKDFLMDHNNNELLTSSLKQLSTLNLLRLEAENSIENFTNELSMLTGLNKPKTRTSPPHYQAPRYIDTLSISSQKSPENFAYEDSILTGILKTSTLYYLLGLALFYYLAKWLFNIIFKPKF